MAHLIGEFDNLAFEGETGSLWYRNDRKAMERVTLMGNGVYVPLDKAAETTSMILEERPDVCQFGDTLIETGKKSLWRTDIPEPICLAAGLGRGYAGTQHRDILNMLDENLLAKFPLKIS